MGIKETPVNFRVYYKLFIEDNKEKLKEANKHKEELEAEVNEKYELVRLWTDVYKTQFNVDLEKYEEFTTNKYINGKFFKIAKGLLINKQNNYELVTDLFNLYDLASTQKELYDLEHNIQIYTKCSKLKIKEYTEILRTYYTEVHKKLILEGKGYSFSNGIGWICVNRVLLPKRAKMLDYQATKRREKELIAEGKKIYNKEEADWCLRNGIEYKAEDKRVFVQNEYCYQIPLLDSTLPGGYSLKLELSDYRHADIRGQSNEDLLNKCKKDTTKICELPIGLKTKLTLCDKADKILYTKFIRNENQKPYTFKKINR